MNHFEFAYHVDKIAHLKQLGKYNKIQAYVDKQNPKMQSALSGWMSQTLADLQDDSVGARLPESSFCCIKGWQAFYRHQYADALQLFLQAQKQSDCHLFATDSSLGIAKVYTRTGHWQLAKDWCLYYLAKARDLSLSHVDIAKGYGALAEIFLRANKPQQSLGCFQIAYHLMPLQSGQKSKQYNFMASALLRHGEFLRAEALLQNSHQNNLRLLKADPENIELQSGLLHAQMRLMFLSLLRKKPVVLDELSKSLLVKSSCKISQKTMPSGMLIIAQGIADLQEGRTERAASQFYQALQVFDGKMLFEYLWALRLYRHCQPLSGSNEGNALHRLQQTQALSKLAHIEAPITQNVVDMTWKNVELYNHGFEQLFDFSITQDELIALWQQFFI